MEKVTSSSLVGSTIVRAGGGNIKERNSWDVSADLPLGRVVELVYT